VIILKGDTKTQDIVLKDSNCPRTLKM